MIDCAICDNRDDYSEKRSRWKCTHNSGLCGQGINMCQGCRDDASAFSRTDERKRIIAKLREALGAPGGMPFRTMVEAVVSELEGDP